MTTTPKTYRRVLDAIRASPREWPHSQKLDTENDNPWALAWDAATFMEFWFEHDAHNDVEEAICNLPIDAAKYGYATADWHSQHSPNALLKSHVLRIVKGWGGEKALHDYLTTEPELVEDLGFTDGLPSQSTLWRVWNDDRLSREHQEVLTTIGQIVVDVAREHGVSAPDEVFHPNPSVNAPDEVEQDDATVRERTIAKTREVWQHAKPMVTEHYSLPRADNIEVHENAFWEAHAYIGSREYMCAEDGTSNFAAETTRDRVQTGSTHRHHLLKIRPDDAREMHRNTTRELIKRARQDSELDGGVLTSIDITKGNPYSENTIIEFKDGKLANRWLLGYKERGYEDKLPDLYFQWASIQVVGLDIPLVLDVVPVSRGMPRAKIVDTLLTNAKEMVDIDLVMMDREFDGEAVKDVCEKHDVHYLNPSRMMTSDRAQCTRLRRQGKLVHIEEDVPGRTKPTTLTEFEEEETDDENDDPVRKRVFVPAMKANRTSDDFNNDDEHDQAEDESSSEKDGLRQELLEEFAEATDEDVERVGSMFGDVIDEIHEEESDRELPGNEADTRLYILFETNHPEIELPEDGMGNVEQAHMASRLIRRYKHRWGIENGFKQIKGFRVRTTSMKYEYRFFNFLFACTLYNVWRLVDLLVKLELLAGNRVEYKPLVTADLFLTIAKDHRLVGLDPPPD